MLTSTRFRSVLGTKDVDIIVQTIKAISPTFGGINLEDISAPRCFEIEKRLREECDIPVFHDDQHGTAIVVGAGLLNALKVVNKSMETVKIAVNGAGAAGIAIVKHLKNIGFKQIVICDSKGIIYKGRPNGMNPTKDEIAEITNPKWLNRLVTNCRDDRSDVFIGVSAANILTLEFIDCMSSRPDCLCFGQPRPRNHARFGKGIWSSRHCNW